MQRTAETLLTSGARVTLVGRKRRSSKPLAIASLENEARCTLTRLKCFFDSGPLFYLEYNLRLFLYLMRTPDIFAVTACDPDTLAAFIAVRKFRSIRMIYDAHEYFTEVPELEGHPVKKRIWSLIERTGVRLADVRYTVNASLAGLLSRRYGADFEMVHNFPGKLGALRSVHALHQPIRLFYQGALNEGRGLEVLVRSMTHIPDARLTIIGEGVMRPVIEREIEIAGVTDRVELLGFITPDRLYEMVNDMDVSFNLLDSRSLNYYYSSGNKFFDAARMCIPQITMDFPEYRRFNDMYEVAILIPELSIDGVVKALQILRQADTYQRLRANCKKVASEWHWQKNEATLQRIYIPNLPVNL